MGNSILVAGAALIVMLVVVINITKVPLLPFWVRAFDPRSRVLFRIPQVWKEGAKVSDALWNKNAGLMSAGFSCVVRRQDFGECLIVQL